MEFVNWYLDVVKNKYAKFDGRAGRPEYWFFVLGNFVAAIVLSILSRIPVIGLLFAVVLLLFMVAILVPAIAVTTRRLHDTGRSGWWQLLYFVPLAGIVVFVFTLLPSAAGNNNFGPPGPTSPGK